ncbi:MAG TPA: MFS transporter [Actinomycetota bacterium]|nr:MFS transporter [Actinomycetota bacterium]
MSALPGRRRILLDLTPLRRFPAFRRLWFGQLVSQLGSQLTVVAIPFQVYRLTHSSLDVGLISLVQLGPLLLGSLLGGSVADAVDRRRLLVLTQLALGGCSAGLALNAGRGHPALWPLFALSAVAAGFSGVDIPTRAAAIVTLVDEASLVAANVLRQLLFQVALVAGPAVAGLLIAHTGTAVVYTIDTATFGAALIAVLSLPALRPAGGGTRAGWTSALEGLRYLKGRPALQGTFLLDLDAMIFGMPRALFPALGIAQYHGGAAAVGYLYAAPGAGALLGALLTGWSSSVRRQGRAVIVAVTAWGLAIAAFGFTPYLPFGLSLGLLLLAIAGAADVLSAVFRGTILQLETPDRLGGRLFAIQTAVVTGGPRLGDAEAGVVASLATVPVSVVTGGLVCVLGALALARALPGFTGYTPPQSRAE